MSLSIWAHQSDTPRLFLAPELTGSYRTPSSQLEKSATVNKSEAELGGGIQNLMPGLISWLHPVHLGAAGTPETGAFLPQVVPAGVQG